MSEQSEPTIVDYGEELQSAIFNLVISLVSHRAVTVGYPKAREETADHLDKLSSALKEMQ